MWFDKQGFVKEEEKEGELYDKFDMPSMGLKISLTQWWVSQ